MDCFQIGPLHNTNGVVWQIPAIDVASGWCWAELHVTPRNPSPRWTSKLARTVAADLAETRWRLEKVTTDRGNEFVSGEFRDEIDRLEARHAFIPPGRPQANGCVERVQQTILEECWKPAFARFLIRSITGYGWTWSATSATTTPIEPTPGG